MRILGICGSLQRESGNLTLLRTAARLAPSGVELVLFDGARLLPPFDPDLEQAGAPAAVVAWREALAASDAVLIASPEYGHSLPGALKNAIDWASRPWGKNSFTRKPSGVIGASPGLIGTALAQQSLRGVLCFCNSPMMNTVEAYIHFTPDLISADGEVSNDKTREFLRNYMSELRDFIQRVLTVLPRTAS